MEKADLAVIIGRFAPPHLSHKTLIHEAYQHAHNVLILVGSSNAARTIKNPFTFEERRNMLMTIRPRGDKGKPLSILPIEDSHYSDDLWIAQVQEKVGQHLESLGLTRHAETVMVGNYSDASSYYLTYFPQWEKVQVKGVSDIHSTDIRRDLFYDGNHPQDEVLREVPEEIHQFLKLFCESEVREELRREYQYIKDYKASWAKVPFPPTFVTVDNVVTCMGHVLVIKRKTQPGKGLYAIPGGFIRENEFIQDAALRELKEETGIRVDKPVLRRCIVDQKVFDYPGRSLRGRTITHAFHLKLEGKELPEVRGGDDASHAFWLPFAEVISNRNQFFEDHASIIRAFLGV